MVDSNHGLQGFGGSEPRVRQWVRRIFRQIRQEFIYEVWDAVLVALHKPPETAPFSISGRERCSKASRLSAVRGTQKWHRKSIRGVHKN